MVGDQDRAGEGAPPTSESTHQAQARLRESEERFRQFAENSTDTLWIIDAGTRRLEYLSPAFERMWGEPRETVMRDLARWAELVHPDDLGRVRDGLSRLLAGETLTQEYRIVRPSDGAVRWIRDTGFPVRDEAGRIARLAGIARDVTEEKQAEEHQKLLLAELQHRVRNTLAVMRSISRRTAEASRSVEDYAAHFDGRLSSFARIQALVIRAPAAGVDLECLIAEEMLAHLAQEGDSIRISGPKIRLQPRAAESLGLAVHELATNAVKYGALSRDTGVIAITWSIVPDGAHPALRFEWVETGVPIVAQAPRHRGFGTELLEHGLAYELRASTALTFDPGRVRCVIELPLTPKIVVEAPVGPA